MIRLEMKKYNKILTEKQQIYLLHNQVNLMKENTLQVKKYYYLIKAE